MFETVGYVAMTFTVTSFLPQTIKCWYTRKTRDVSVFTWSLNGIGAAFWTWYAVTQGSVPLLITNIIVLVGAGSIVVAKGRYG